MRRFLKWTGIVLGLLIILLLAWYVLVFDWNDIKGHIAAAVGKRTQREFSIGGDVDVNLSLSPRIRLEQVRLENAEWAERPWMVEIAALEFTLELLPLLRGRVVLPEVHFERPRVRLHRNKKGVANWNFVAEPGGEVAKEALPEERGEVPAVGRLSVSDGRFVYRDEPRGIQLDGHINTAVGLRHPGKESVRLEGSGQLSGEPFSLAVSGGSLLMLREEDDPYPIEVDATVGRTSIHVTGTAADPVQAAGLDLRMSMAGPSLAEIFHIFEVPLPPTRPYKVAGHLTREGATWRFRDFSGEVGKSELSGTLEVKTGGARPVLQGDINSDKLRLSDLAGLIGIHPEPRKRDKLLPTVPIARERLQAMDMDVSFRAERLLPPQLPVQAMQYHLVLENGRMSVEPLEFRVAGGTVAGAVYVDVNRPEPDLVVRLDLQQLQLGRFLPETGPVDVARGVFGGQVRFNGNGDTIREAILEGDGGVWISMSGGAIDKIVVAAAGLNLADLLGLLGQEETPVPLRCSVAAFDLDEGVLRSEVVVVDTENSTLVGNGAINLRQETVDMRLEAHPKEVQPFSLEGAIELEGPLRSPSPELDLAGAAGQAGAAVALGALLGPLAAVIPFIEPGLGVDTQCSALFAKAKGAIEKEDQ